MADILKSITQAHDISATIIKVNTDGVPLNRRVLVEMKGMLPADYEPMTDNIFLPLANLG